MDYTESHLLTLPWRALNFNDAPLLAKFCFSKDSYTILCTDTIGCWGETCLANECLSKNLKLNPNFESSAEKLLQLLEKTLENVSSGQEKLKDYCPAGDGCFILMVETKLAGVAFLWNFTLKQCAQQLLHTHLVQPCFDLIFELNRHKRELIKVIRAKEREIEDYKLQGVTTRRKNLQTTEFEEEKFANDMEKSLAKCFTPGFHGNLVTEECKQLYIKLNQCRSELSSSASPVPSPSSGSSSAVSSPAKSPQKSPEKPAVKRDPEALKDTEKLRRQALEERLAEEAKKKELKNKKKKLKL